MKRFRTIALAVLAAATMAGCKMTLYSNVAEAEANQMLALLMLRHIPRGKGGGEGRHGDAARRQGRVHQCRGGPAAERLPPITSGSAWKTCFRRTSW
ncbi:hypothetical protein [Cupriavidus sp. H18C1]|uniref:hypothetical protein n=1 Tax=Cupriavidus sp. H18C1 TaxID=3241601 RepID=UPI003BB90FCD